MKGPPLPGAERIRCGLRDLAAGRQTADSLLVSIASSRLRDLDVPVPAGQATPGGPELALYELLRASADDPYYAYRAALAELDSFLASLESRR